LKLLMFYTPLFRWEPASRTLPEAEDPAAPGEANNCVTAFIHVESSDPSGEGRIITRAIKNIKWLAGKFGTRAVVLHYFSHLSSDRSEPAAARGLLEAMASRLSLAGYTVRLTPYGWVNRLAMEVTGESLGRVFVDIGPAGDQLLDKGETS
jgi:hypothetical protein